MLWIDTRTITALNAAKLIVAEKRGLSLNTSIAIFIKISVFLLRCEQILGVDNNFDPKDLLCGSCSDVSNVRMFVGLGGPFRH